MSSTSKHTKPPLKFFQGAIPPESIVKAISNHKNKTNIGAHQIFLGQVRADIIEDKQVEAIEYSAYEDMVNKTCRELREQTFANFPITCMHIYHSLGIVNSGDICFMVFTSGAHRKEAIDACNFFVENFKSKVPIYGKELFADNSHIWKVNK